MKLEACVVRESQVALQLSILEVFHSRVHCTELRRTFKLIKVFFSAFCCCSLSLSLSLSLCLCLCLCLSLSLCPLKIRGEIQQTNVSIFPAVEYCKTRTYFIEKSKEQAAMFAMNQTVETIIYAFSSISAQPGEKKPKQ